MSRAPVNVARAPHASAAGVTGATVSTPCAPDTRYSFWSDACPNPGPDPRTGSPGWRRGTSRRLGSGTCFWAGFSSSSSGRGVGSRTRRATRRVPAFLQPPRPLQLLPREAALVKRNLCCSRREVIHALPKKLESFSRNGLEDMETIEVRARHAVLVVLRRNLGEPPITALTSALLLIFTGAFPPHVSSRLDREFLSTIFLNVNSPLR